MNSSTKLRFSTAAAKLTNPFSLNIDTVPLAFQKYSPKPGSSSPCRPIPPIVFLHGLCGNKNNNRTSARVFAKELNTDVYCLDLRNHGVSPHSNRHDTPALAADVEWFIQDQGISKPIVVGHSMGAKTAMAIPLRRKDLVSAVISVDNAPQENILAKDEFIKFKKRLKCLQRILKHHPPLKTVEQADYILSEVEPDKLVRMFMLNNLETKKGIHSKVPLQILIENLDNIRKWEFGSELQWPGPALLIQATQSPFVDGVGHFRQIFPNGVHKEIVSGHWVITEQNKLFNQTCIDFIRSAIIS